MMAEEERMLPRMEAPGGAHEDVGTEYVPDVSGPQEIPALKEALTPRDSWSQSDSHIRASPAESIPMSIKRKMQHLK